MPELRAQPIPKSKLTNNPFGKLPFGYVICEEDLCVPPNAQDQMVTAKMNEGAEFRVWREPFDHEAHLSSTDRLAAILMEFGQETCPA